MTIAGFKITPEHVVHLRTERLVMRRFTLEDDQLIVDLDSDPEVVRWVGNPEPTTLAVVHDRIFKNVLAWYDKGPNHGYWATHEIATGDFIGWFHFRPAKLPPHELELGYLGMLHERQELEDGKIVDWYAVSPTQYAAARR